MNVYDRNYCLHKARHRVGHFDNMYRPQGNLRSIGLTARNGNAKARRFIRYVAPYLRRSRLPKLAQRQPVLHRYSNLDERMSARAWNKLLAPRFHSGGMVIGRYSSDRPNFSAVPKSLKALEVNARNFQIQAQNAAASMEAFEHVLELHREKMAAAGIMFEIMNG